MIAVACKLMDLFKQLTHLLKLALFCTYHKQQRIIMLTDAYYTPAAQVVLSNAAPQLVIAPSEPVWSLVSVITVNLTQVNWCLLNNKTHNHLNLISTYCAYLFQIALMQWSPLLLQVGLFVPCTAAVKQYTAKRVGGAQTVQKSVGMSSTCWLYCCSCSCSVLLS